MEERGAYVTQAAPVKPRIPPLLCPHCEVLDLPTLGPGAGQHIARACCSHCHRFIKWLPRALVGPQKEGRCMGGVNRVILVGTISKYGVTVKYAPSGTPCASFALVLSEVGQDGKVHTLFQDCEVWGKKAESVSEFEAGQLCLFEGRLARRKQAEQWTTVISGFDLTPITAPLARMTGSSN